MTDPIIFSTVSALRAVIAAHPETDRIVMSAAAWSAVKEEAIMTLAPVQIMDIEGGERSFNRVTIMLHNERL